MSFHRQHPHISFDSFGSQGILLDRFVIKREGFLQRAAMVSQMDMYKSYRNFDCSYLLAASMKWILKSAACLLAPSNTSLLFLISDYYFYNPVVILQTYHAFVVHIRCFSSRVELAVPVSHHHPRHQVFKIAPLLVTNCTV